MVVNFKSRKLKSSIIKITEKVKDNFSLYNTYTVFGVTKDEGISITGNLTSKDLSEYIVVDENTFAFNPYRVNIGSIGLSGNNFKGLVSPAYVVFKTKKDLLPEFLFSFLKSDTGIKLINWYGNRGGVRNALRFDDLGEIDIPDLNVEEQKEALININKASSKLSILNEELSSQQTYLQQLRQSILEEAVQGKLTQQNPTDEPASKLLERIKAEKQQLIAAGKLKKEKPLSPITAEEIPFELPKGWVWCRLGEIFKFIDYRGKTPSRTLQGVRLISAKNVKFGYIDNYPIEFIAENEYDKWMVRGFPRNGDILFVTEGHTMGFVAIINLDFKYVLAQRTICLQPFEYSYPAFIFYSLMSPIIQVKIKEMATGSAAMGVQSAKLKELLIPIPPLLEQELIVAKVQQLMQMVNQLEQQVQQSQTQAQQLLQAVLKEAFRSNTNAYEENELVTMAAEA